MKTDVTVANELTFLSIVSDKIEKKEFLRYMISYKRSIAAVAKKITGSTAAALKVTEAVFLLGRLKFDQFHDLAEFNVWMHKTAANFSVDYLINNAKPLQRHP